MEKTNIAFKCNFCNGGRDIDKNYYGFNGVCSQQVIEYNIKKAKNEWCTHPRCACMRYYKGEIGYRRLERIYYQEGSLCYESAMLKNWEASAGWDNKGKRGDRPRRIINADVGSVAMLTLVTPNSYENERRIFALFLIDDYFIGDDEWEGYVSSESKYRLHMTRKETNDMRFWDYYSNENTSECRWGSGLFRYINDKSAARILKQAKLLKIGTEDEKLAKEMYEKFCKYKEINLSDILAPIEISEI